MYRALITVAAAAALVIGGVAPATAAPSSSAPGAPTAVRVTGAGDSATVTWGPPKSGAKVTGWKVTISPAQHQPDQGVDRLPAKARSDRFGDLTPKTTYRFSVRAIGAKKTGRTTLVRYTTPSVVDTTQSLFALDASGNVVRFAEDGSGTGKVVAAKGTGFAADDVGDVFTPSADLTSILFHPADGSATRTLATGLHLTPDLRSDVAGNLYWIDSATGAVQKLPVGSSTATTVLDLGGTATRQRPALLDRHPGRQGRRARRARSARRTSRAPASRPRSITSPGSSGVGYPAAVLADSHGNVYVDIRSPGAAGSWAWYQLKPGATALERHRAPAGVRVRGRERRRVLAAAVRRVVQRPRRVPDQPDRLQASTARSRTSSWSAPVGRPPWRSPASRRGRAGRTRAPPPTTATSSSTSTAEPSAGLWRVPASGGAAQQLSSAQYSRLLVI